MPDDFDGKGVVDVTNVGGQIHEMVMVKLNDGQDRRPMPPSSSRHRTGAPPFTTIPASAASSG